jgi:hypothetical protein
MSWFAFDFWYQSTFPTKIEYVLAALSLACQALSGQYGLKETTRAFFIFSGKERISFTYGMIRIPEDL